MGTEHDEQAQDDDFPPEEPLPEEITDQVQADPATVTVTETEAEPAMEDVPVTETPAPLTPETTRSDTQVDTLDISKSEGERYWEQQTAGQKGGGISTPHTTRRKNDLRSVVSKTIRKLWA